MIHSTVEGSVTVFDFIYFGNTMIIFGGLLVVAQVMVDFFMTCFMSQRYNVLKVQPSLNVVSLEEVEQQRRASESQAISSYTPVPRNDHSEVLKRAVGGLRDGQVRGAELAHVLSTFEQRLNNLDALDVVNALEDVPAPLERLDSKWSISSLARSLSLDRGN
eukprot:gnl/TRDRNA2_/TRDRNA2_150347_c2_seq1.p1 gnl/TRDRNA2_/TRDRNA2_150347_c2~~gnl/TRDRNA2_/TRDRNA2_150347_c2_seq1.p1  ORF type:complete len:162 (+),score=17.61 gnl/TRDRNA2_/TRDRNA2_150347_c2_seq1:2-487(+)